MSKARKKWELKPKAPQSYFEQFADYNPLVAQLFYNSGLLQKNEVDNFLLPKYENLNDPFLFRDMEKACKRIWDAIANEEKIAIYGDYDADAVTANAVLHQTFSYLGVSVQSYIPDRFTEGYGLNIEAFEKLKQDGVTVVITVDCGTNSVDVADFCKPNEIDLIITDHHEITGKIPESYALINPKNPEDKYPDSQITGVGVAYKLAAALLSNKEQVCLVKDIPESEFIPGWDKWLLDLVAIGTVADCHSLMGENRILVSSGLKVLAKTKWLGLRYLCMLSGVDLGRDILDARTLGFQIAPRINAAGRLEHADIALALLLAQDPAKAQELSSNIEIINKRRQDITMRVVSEAKEQAEIISDRKIILLWHDQWPKGVVGLAAGRLAEIYKKPVIVLEKGETESTGSARTGSNFNIVEALKFASEFLAKFGGHKQAAGLTIKNENFEDFYKAILEYADKNPTPENEVDLELDAELFGEHLNLDVLDSLSVFEPYGIGNPKPQFLISGATISGFKPVGKEAQHLQLTFDVSGNFVEAIAFNFGWLAKTVTTGAVANIAVELLGEVWNGRRKFKLRLIDINLNV